MRKRVFAGLFAALMLLSLTAFAASTDKGLVVANPTKLQGMFFTDKWGNNTSDIDVRALLHGLSTVEFRGDGTFVINGSAVKHYSRQFDAQNNLTYTFELFEGMKFSDGSPLTAHDYVFSALLQSSPAFLALGQSDPKPYAHLLGYDAFAKGDSEIFAGVRLLSDTSFSLTIVAQALPYYHELNLANVTPYPMAVLANDSELVDEGEGAAFKAPLSQQALEAVLLGDAGYLSHPAVTSGPYHLVAYDKASGEASFEMNPNYRGNYEGQRPSINRLTLTQANYKTAINDLTSGKVGLVNKITWGKADAEAAKQANWKQIQTVTYNRRGLAFLSLNCDTGETQSLQLRQALAHLVNRSSIIRLALNNQAIPVYGYYGMGQEMVQGQQDALKTLLNLYPFKVAEAEKLLIEAGWDVDKNGNPLGRTAGKARFRADEKGNLSPLTLSLAISDNNPVGEVVYKQLKQDFARAGITLTLVQIEPTAFFEQYYRLVPRTSDLMFLGSNFDMGYDPALAFSADAENRGANNPSGIADAGLAEKAQSLNHTYAGDLLLYEQKWQSFQLALVGQLPLIPLYSNVYRDAFAPGLSNYHPDLYFGWAQAILYAAWQ